MSLQDPNLATPRTPKRVAIVISNVAVSSITGWPVGFWWSELTHTYYELIERGYQIEVFSPLGGKCEADSMSDPRDPSGYSVSDLISLGFIHTPALAALPATTKPVEQIDVNAFHAIVVAGGQGTSRAHSVFAEGASEGPRAGGLTPLGDRFIFR